MTRDEDCYRLITLVAVAALAVFLPLAVVFGCVLTEVQE